MTLFGIILEYSKVFQSIPEYLEEEKISGGTVTALAN